MLRAPPKMLLSPIVAHVEYHSFRSFIVRTRRGIPIARNLSDKIKARGLSAQPISDVLLTQFAHESQFTRLHDYSTKNPSS